MMRKTPGFTVMAVLVLTLAIGGTTAMFSIINALFYRPPAVKNPDDWSACMGGKKRRSWRNYRDFSYPNYVDLRGRTRCFATWRGLR